MTITRLKKKLKSLANSKRAEHSASYLQTKNEGYGKGDRFLGIIVPNLRKVAKQFRTLTLPELEELLQNPIHEYRLTSLFIIIDQFQHGDIEKQKRLIELYKRNLRFVNNWDLVDISAPNLFGIYLQNRSKKILYNYTKSPDLWRRRVGIMSTFGFIRQGEYKDTLAIAKILVNDEHDLIHKAVGWMLREIGKRDKEVLITFLDKHHKKMPRTMLRYSIEKFNKKERTHYMKN